MIRGDPLCIREGRQVCSSRPRTKALRTPDPVETTSPSLQFFSGVVSGSAVLTHARVLELRRPIQATLIQSSGSRVLAYCGV